MDIHPQLLEVVLEERRYLGSQRVAGARDNRELHPVSGWIHEVARIVPREAAFLEDAARLRNGPSRVRQVGVNPVLVPRRLLGPKGSGSAPKNQADHAFSIERERDGFAETRVSKPSLLLRDCLHFLGTAFGQVVEIEKEKVILEARSKVLELVFRMAAVRKRAKVLGAQRTQYVNLTGTEAQNLRVRTGHNEVSELVQVRQSPAGAIRLPVIGIPFELDKLPGDELLQTKWPETRHLIGRSVEPPGLIQPLLFVSLSEQVLRQDGDAVKKAFGGGIRLRQIYLNRVLPRF